MKSDPKEKFYSISDLASEFEISPRSIRFYEEKGLISPSRTGGNQRIYDKRDRARLKLILRGKRFGYSLEEIAEMIGMTDAEIGEVDQIEASLAYGEKKLREIRDRIEELRFLERDLVSVKHKLLKRLDELEREGTEK
ncbi:MAG: MerR family DNA-binding transcriptional regulator [Desulfomonile tiedjei]|uniref:MerR family DNA-binding transcriptional regulator n=1 Tax=Desulfomonile tiedjei TaxID=2358 RepID=A0A9D6V5E6_9BACT|nr:MerR family DNA-binding transcriptional regulator [Desulfomonile tiedjei]